MVLANCSVHAECQPASQPASRPPRGTSTLPGLASHPLLWSPAPSLCDFSSLLRQLIKAAPGIKESKSVIKVSPKREALDVMASLVNSIQHLKNSCALLVGMSNGATMVENHMVISQNIKYRITIRSSNSTSGVPQRIENRVSKKYLHTNIQRRIIHNNQKV